MELSPTSRIIVSIERLLNAFGCHQQPISSTRACKQQLTEDLKKKNEQASSLNSIYAPYKKNVLSLKSSQCLQRFSEMEKRHKQVESLR